MAETHGKGGRPPDYNVACLDKSNGKKSSIGAAWDQPDGSIQIKINPFVLLDTYRMDLLISLFPNDGKRRGKSQTDVVPLRAVKDDGPDVQF